MLRGSTLAIIGFMSAVALTASVRADPPAPYFEVQASIWPQAPSDLTINLSFADDAPQFAALVFDIPREWGVARGEDIPVGTKIGQVSSLVTVGLIGSPCNAPIPVDFSLHNASLNPEHTVSFDDLELREGVHPSAEGFGIRDFAEDKDGNTLVDAIDRYPDFLNESLRGVRPLVRIAGVTPVAGVPILLQFLIFTPGTHLSLPDPELSASVKISGYPMVMIVQKFGDLDSWPEPGPITDSCSPRETSIVFAPPEGAPSLFVNPQSGRYAWDLMAFSRRDADVDGIENSLDTCPHVANSGDPTVPDAGDADGDGLDVACDPNDDSAGLGVNYDVDEDAYLNRQDNCPLVANGMNYDAAGALQPPAWQTDEDFDDIGDACDPNPTVPDGKLILFVPSAEVVVGEPSGSGGPPSVDACPHCYRANGAVVERDTEGSGGQLAVAIGLITLGAGAGAVVVGGGAAYLVRRRRG